MSFKDEMRKDLELAESMLENLESELREVGERIKELEAKYGISSEEFLKDRSGVSEEDREEWVSLLFYRENLEKGLEPLRREIEKLRGRI